MCAAGTSTIKLQGTGLQNVLCSCACLQVVSRDIRRILTDRAFYFGILLDDVSITHLTFSKLYEVKLFLGWWVSTKTRICAYGAHTLTFMCVRASACACVHAHTNTHVHTGKNTDIQTIAHTHTNKHTHTYVHTYACARTHKYTLTHAHANNIYNTHIQYIHIQYIHIQTCILTTHFGYGCALSGQQDLDVWDSCVFELFCWLIFNSANACSKLPGRAGSLFSITHAHMRTHTHTGLH
jgi:hypothetical protein